MSDTQHLPTIVLRAAPGMSLLEMPEGMEGRWLDRRSIPFSVAEPSADVTVATATATPTDRFEVREDGAVAQVYEVRW